MKFTQLPGTLDVEIVQGDEVAFSADFDVDITGFSIEAPIYVKQVFTQGVGGVSSGTAVGETVTNFTVVVSDAAAGVVALGLTEAQTELLIPTSAYRWYLRWVDTSGYTRTILSGDVISRNP